MWSNFYADGGFGMYPTSLFGFALIAVSVLHARRPGRKTEQLVRWLAILTLASGLLGTSTGLVNSFRYIQEVQAPKQLETLALGCAESLHNLVLALILGIVSGLVSLVGALREPAGSGLMPVATKA
ncbi:MAG: hypothetical protein EXR75_15330 [Myxococcales bacterium]|nr:hypothetical protein [Myxococcales bacterium]